MCEEKKCCKTRVIQSGGGTPVADRAVTNVGFGDLNFALAPYASAGFPLTTSVTWPSTSTGGAFVQVNVLIDTSTTVESSAAAFTQPSGFGIEHRGLFNINGSPSVVGGLNVGEFSVYYPTGYDLTGIDTGTGIRRQHSYSLTVPPAYIPIAPGDVVDFVIDPYVHNAYGDFALAQMDVHHIVSLSLFPAV